MAQPKALVIGVRTGLPASTASSARFSSGDSCFDGGEPVRIPRLREDDVPISFTPDGRELFVARYTETPPLVERVDIATGRRRPWTAMRRGRSSGNLGHYRVLVTPDGASYAYSYFRRLDDLYLLTGLK